MFSFNSILNFILNWGKNNNHFNFFYIVIIILNLIFIVSYRLSLVNLRINIIRQSELTQSNKVYFIFIFSNECIHRLALYPYHYNDYDPTTQSVFFPLFKSAKQYNNERELRTPKIIISSRRCAAFVWLIASNVHCL